MKGWQEGMQVKLMFNLSNRYFKQKKASAEVAGQGLRGNILSDYLSRQPFPSPAISAIGRRWR